MLKYDFFLAEQKEALGYKGLVKTALEPQNVQFIDCTEFVDGHSGYFEAAPLYSFFKNQQTGGAPSSINVKLLSNGLTAAK